MASHENSPNWEDANTNFMPDSNLPVSQNGLEQPEVSASGPPEVITLERLQKQLYTLYHASKCQKADNGGICHFSCQLAKKVLKHMMDCSIGRACTVGGCFISRHVLTHFKACTKLDCCFCMPFKKPAGIHHPLVYMWTDINSLYYSAAYIPTHPNQNLVARETRRANCALGYRFNNVIPPLVAVPCERVLLHACKSDFDTWERT